MKRKIGKKQAAKSAPGRKPSARRSHAKPTTLKRSRVQDAPRPSSRNGASDDGAPAAELDTILSEVAKPSDKRAFDQWAQISCPYCGENFEIHVESQEDGQSIYQDCQVCCKPISIFVQIDENEDMQVSVARS